jgi:hypothetical protein
LNNHNILWNGIFKDTYEPYIIEKEGNRIAIFTCTDMMNREFSPDCPWKILKIDDRLLNDTIIEYKNRGYFVILYAHVGLLFTRFPNPPIRKLLHEKIELGVDVIITVHPHVLGGCERYKDKPVFYSIGDFVMDGGSFRRRRAGMLEFDIRNNQLLTWNLIPTMINNSLQTVIPEDRIKRKMLKSWDHVSNILNNNMENYDILFRKLYKKEMLQHSWSTFQFLLATKGVIGTLKLLILRIDDVKMIRNWTKTDRSSMRYDTDAIKKDRKKISLKEFTK